MKQFRTILGFELTNYLKNKVFIGVTLFLVAVIALVMFVPPVLDADVSDETPAIGDSNIENTEGSDVNDSASVMLISFENSESAEVIRQAFAAAFTDYNVQLTNDSVDDIKAKISDGTAECAFIFNSLTSYTYYVENLGIY